MLLENVLVLDLTRLMPGFCTLLLADLGATVVKVEAPGRGDYLRELGTKVGGEGYAFLMMNRNKKSITLNLKSKEGVEIFRDLVSRSDILVESFRPGVMDRLGLGYESLATLNPRLIYCAISGYGQTGPYRDLSGHDLDYLAVGGVIGLGPLLEGRPALPAVPIADFESSQRAVVAILASLYRRERDGKGRFLDIAMYEGCPSWLMQPLAEFFGRGEKPQPEAFTVPDDDRWVGRTPGYGVYRTADGFITLCAAEEKFWRNLCETLGRPELAEARQDVANNGAMIERAIDEALQAKGRDEWIAAFRANDVPCAPVSDLDELVADPHVAHRGVFGETEHPRVGTIRQIATLPGIGETSPLDRLPAPALGEHTHEVLTDLGFDAAAIERFKSEGTV